jgi:hypothetical protein
VLVVLPVRHRALCGVCAGFPATCPGYRAGRSNSKANPLAKQVWLRRRVRPIPSYVLRGGLWPVIPARPRVNRPGRGSTDRVEVQLVLPLVADRGAVVRVERNARFQCT